MDDKHGCGYRIGMLGSFVAICLTSLTGRVPPCSCADEAKAHRASTTACLYLADGVRRTKLTGVDSFAVAPDGSRLAYCCDGEVRLALLPEVLSLKREGVFPGHVVASGSGPMAWSHSGNYLAVSARGDDRRWSVQTLDVRDGTLRHVGAGRCVCWSPGDDRLAVGHGNNIVVYDVRSMRQVQRFPVEGDGPGVVGMAWSPDGRQLTYSASALGVLRTVHVDSHADEPLTTLLLASPAYSYSGDLLLAHEQHFRMPYGEGDHFEQVGINRLWIVSAGGSPAYPVYFRTSDIGVEGQIHGQWMPEDKGIAFLDVESRRLTTATISQIVLK